jgi:ribosomal protein L7/L12
MKFFYSIGYYFARARFELARGYREGFAPPTGEKDRELRILIMNDPVVNYIPAIKQYRVLHGSSLRDAKNAIDSMYADLKLDGPYKRG